jgi:hypothetical protein
VRAAGLPAKRALILPEALHRLGNRRGGPAIQLRPNGLHGRVITRRHDLSGGRLNISVRDAWSALPFGSEARKSAIHMDIIPLQIMRFPLRLLRTIMTVIACILWYDFKHEIGNSHSDI